MKDIIEKVENTHKFDSPEEVKQYIFALHDICCSIEDIKDRCESKDWNFKEGALLKTKLIEPLIKAAMGRALEKSQEEKIVLYVKEKEKLDSIEEDYRWLMYSLLMYSKFDNHPTGWIKYTPKLIDNFLGHQSKLKSNILMHRCCDEHWLELRVVGSKNPVTCYRVTFRETEGEEFATMQFDQPLDAEYHKIWGGSSEKVRV